MWNLIVEGRWFMAPLLGCSVLAAAVILERWLALRAYRREAASFLGDFDQRVGARDLDGARELCRGDGRLASAMMRAALERFDELGEQENIAFVHDQINRAVEDEGNFSVGELETHLGILAAIGTIAPLLGFAGTVTGMIEAFGAVAQANDVSPSLVAGGISQALITTAAGLIVAIPSIVAFHFFSRQVTDLTTAMEQSANRLLSTLVRAWIESRRESRTASGGAKESKH